MVRRLTSKFTTSAKLSLAQEGFQRKRAASGKGEITISHHRNSFDKLRLSA
jgi:hypothetical protein